MRTNTEAPRTVSVAPSARNTCGSRSGCTPVKPLQFDHQACRRSFVGGPGHAAPERSELHKNHPNVRVPYALRLRACDSRGAPSWLQPQCEKKKKNAASHAGLETKMATCHPECRMNQTPTQAFPTSLFCGAFIAVPLRSSAVVQENLALHRTFGNSTSAGSSSSSHVPKLGYHSRGSLGLLPLGSRAPVFIGLFATESEVPGMSHHESMVRLWQRIKFGKWHQVLQDGPSFPTGVLMWT